MFPPISTGLWDILYKYLRPNSNQLHNLKKEIHPDECLRDKEVNVNRIGEENFSLDSHHNE